MEKKDCGKIHCGNCEEIIGFFPLDNEPKETIEVYCEGCINKIEDDHIPGNVTYLRTGKYGQNK